MYVSPVYGNRECEGAPRVNLQERRYEIFHQSQPIDPKFGAKFEESNLNRKAAIISQRIGTMFDDLSDEKPDLGTKFAHVWRTIKGWFYHVKYAIRNHIK